MSLAVRCSSLRASSATFSRPKSLREDFGRRLFWKTMETRSPVSTGGGSINVEKQRGFHYLDGIRAIAESGRFKGWFLDQFGVLHDGKRPYPGTISTLEKLANQGAKMVVISNSSRRASVTMEKLENLGFDSSLFIGAITSGELTHQFLQRRDDPWFAALGRSCIHLTWSDRGAISLDDLSLQVVDKVDGADFILAHGTEALGLPLGDTQPLSIKEIEQILVLCRQRNIPMVVANPDFVTVEARDLRVMPGTLADIYEKLGGEVKWMGKPDKVIYEMAMSMAGLDACDCIGVGDSLHHDIKGANNAGIEAVFITGGIHAAELGLTHVGESADPEAVHALASKYDAHLSYVSPSFSW
ncbi:hypothetical protein HPP92_011691 [Vanilla planifolia]|uniref:Uncharacterized protein n=1 Tax=Vanilla planifolia TaxID=51239 RepID=A0A835V0Z6_VANPL|nr:hypothetical protein HPP92_011691 [Vanilla planifolia]